MTKLDLIEYIQRNVYTLANSKHQDPRLATQYILGFLTAQLADAMYEDTRTIHKFKKAVDHAEREAPLLGMRNNGS